MSTMQREPIYAALFAFFSSLAVGASPAFKLATRKLKVWEDCEPEDTPALLMSQVSEGVEFKLGIPQKWRLHVKLFLYANTSAQADDTVIPSQIINPLLDAIQASLAVGDPFKGANTLGGLVTYCAIEGTVETFEGVLGDTAVVVVPITALVSSN